MSDSELLVQLAAAGVALTGALATVFVQCGNKRQAAKKSAKPGSRSSRTLKKSKKSAKSGKSRRADRWNKKSRRGALSARPSTRPATRPSTRSSKKSKSKSSKSSKKSMGAGAKKNSKRSKSSAIAKVPEKAAEAVKQVKQKAEQSLKPESSAKSYSKKEITAQLAKELHVAPQQLRFESSGGRTSVFVHNPTDQRQALKVKCSDNEVYRVSPVYAIVEPHSQALFAVYRGSAPSKVDKLVFVTSQIASGNEDAKAAFKAPGRYPKIAMPLIA